MMAIGYNPMGTGFTTLSLSNYAHVQGKQWAKPHVRTHCQGAHWRFSHTEGHEATHSSLSEVPALQAWMQTHASMGDSQAFYNLSESKESCLADLKDLNTYSGKLPLVRHSTESRRVGNFI